MKKKSSIVKLTLIGVAVIIGFVLAFVPVKLGLYDYNGFTSKIKQGLDLSGGVYAVCTVTSDDKSANISEAVESSMATAKRLLKTKQIDASVAKERGGKFRISVENLSDPQEILAVISVPADIVFRISDEDKPFLEGKHVASASSFADPNNPGVYAVTFSLSSEGAALLETATANNRGSRMEIVLISGEIEEVLSSYSIEDPLKGGMVSMGGMTSMEAATEVAQIIKVGKHSVRISPAEVVVVDSSQSDKAILAGVIVGVVVLVLIIAALCYFYGLFGAAASVSILAQTVLLLFILAVFPWAQLTLPGIAGTLLSIAMTVFGSILICERVKNEYRDGKSILSAAHYGFRKSISILLDISIASVVLWLILLIVGNGATRSMAVVMLIGTLLNAFTNLVCTRGLNNYMVRINPADPKWFRLHRGAGFEDLGADENDAKTEMELAGLAQKKADKKRKEVKDGGNA